jgi:molybdate transport system substrate-binding protein
MSALRLRLVSRNEVQLGIVHASEAKANPNIKVLGTFPEGSHKPIVYPLARLARSDAPSAPTFVAYLRSRQIPRLGPSKV